MSFNIISLEQGSPEWLLWRAETFGASDCSTMLGINPFKSRNALLREKAKGQKEGKNSTYQDAIFEKGHSAEKEAISLLSDEWNEGIYPFVLQKDNSQISASLDGADWNIERIIEHKLYTDSNHAQKRFELAQRGELTEYDMAQVQQQLLVSNAKECWFIVSDGTKENRAVAIVQPDFKWFERIVKGWEKFEYDLHEFLQNGDDSLEIASQYIEIDEQIKELEEKKKVLKTQLENILNDKGVNQMSLGGLMISKQTRRGAIDYSKIDALKEIDLEQYRAKDIEYCTIKIA